MRHTFRLNIYDKGYTLLSGQAQQQFKQFPLDLPSADITKNYLSAQKRLDHIMKTPMVKHSSRWNFCISYANSNENPVVSYGCLLPIMDDKGRTGISFIHAIEADESHSIADIAFCITRLLSPQNIIEIKRKLADLATGSLKVEEAIKFLVGLFAKSYPDKLNIPTLNIEKNNLIKEIRHDCGGAYSIAWLALTISHLGCPSPWEIYEDFNDQSLISTISTAKHSSKTYFLSDYLAVLIRDHESLGILDSLRFGTKKTIAKLNTEKHIHEVVEPSSGCEKKPLSSEGQSGYPKENTTSNQGLSYSSDTPVVTTVELYVSELVLRADGHEYRVRSSNVVSLNDHPDYYEFNFIESKWLGLQKRTIKLALPKANLSERQIEDVRYFKSLCPIGRKP